MAEFPEIDQDFVRWQIGKSGENLTSVHEMLGKREYVGVGIGESHNGLEGSFRVLLEILLIVCRF